MLTLFERELYTVIDQCAREIRLPDDSDPDYTRTFREYQESLMNALKEYQNRMAQARRVAETALIASWRERGGLAEDLADALESGDYSSLAF